MENHKFVLIIRKKTPAHIVERVGKKITQLQGEALEAGFRTLDAVLEDVRKGIPDSLLLKTHLKPYDLQDLLTERLGRDMDSCDIKWV